MFIPRTLAELEGRPGNAALGRALIVVALVAASLFLVLSANITLGQEDLELGQVAPRDIRAPRDVTFDSASLTDEAREAAAADVSPLMTRIKVPADNREDQLAQLQSLGSRVAMVLERRDSGSFDDEEVLDRLVDEEAISFGDRSIVVALTVPQWEAIVAAASTALDTTLQQQIDADDLATIRDEVRELITADLDEDQRAVAGKDAANLVEPTPVIDLEMTEA
jgi:membrane-associated HD superfamily phosphohydrolase